MNIDNITEENGKLNFEFENILLPYVNGLRRVILSNISVVGINGFPNESCDINIIENDTSLNNEIIKHRIISIPVFVLQPSNTNWENLKMVINVKNNTDIILPITSEHISIVDIKSGNNITDVMTRKIFPPDPITGDFVLICYLKPTSNKLKKPNVFHIEATFSVISPEVSSVYNCVSTVAFSNTIDLEKQDIAWNKFQSTLEPIYNMEMEKQNWKHLQGQHYYKEGFYKFTIKSIGFYKNKEILQLACSYISKLLNNIKLLEGVKIIKSKKSNIDNAYDIILENQSYTIGNILKKSIYDSYYPKDISYVGFVVEHPHDTHSILRLSFNNPVDDVIVSSLLQGVCDACVSYIDRINELIITLP